MPEASRIESPFRRPPAPSRSAAPPAPTEAADRAAEKRYTDLAETPPAPAAQPAAEYPGGLASETGPAAPAAHGDLPLRAMTGWEEEFVERNLASPDTARLCNELLARCLVDPGEDHRPALERVRGLLVAERDRALVALRRLSLGPDVSAVVRCPQCGQENQADFSLDALPTGFAVPPPTLAVTLDDGASVDLRLPTAGDQEALVEANLSGAAERRSWLFARIVRRFGERDGLTMAEAHALPVATRRALDTAVERALPDFALNMEVTCEHCRHAFEAPFDVAVFFYPK